jgi:signal transduction histidine kinase
LLDPKYLVTEVVTMAQQTFPKRISVTSEVAPDLSRVVANATQLHQVLLNLCVNARDAMPEGGRIIVRARNVILDASTAESRGLPKGSYVGFEVTDTGTGIPPEIAEKIWAPFFTTKNSGGTGLGLSTVKSIVENHRGAIAVDTRPGETTFRVWLPATAS